jgi:hypothetical protein
LGFDGYVQPQEVVRVFAGIQAAADGQALHDLDKISGGVLGRQEAGDRAGGSRRIFDVAVKCATVGIHVNVCVLAGAHLPKLSFLEVGPDPDVLRLLERLRFDAFEVRRVAARRAGWG